MAAVTDEFELEFVEYIPNELMPRTLYISMHYATCSHLCACGCGARVVTPLSPADWRLTYNGRVDLAPSIGNGQYNCGSHYLIRENRVVWLKPMARDVSRTVHERDTAQRVRISGPGPLPSWRARLYKWLRRDSQRI